MESKQRGASGIFIAVCSLTGGSWDSLARLPSENVLRLLWLGFRNSRGHRWRSSSVALSSEGANTKQEAESRNEGEVKLLIKEAFGDSLREGYMWGKEQCGDCTSK